MVWARAGWRGVLRGVWTLSTCSGVIRNPLEVVGLENPLFQSVFLVILICTQFTLVSRQEDL